MTMVNILIAAVVVDVTIYCSMFLKKTITMKDLVVVAVTVTASVTVTITIMEVTIDQSLLHLMKATQKVTP